MSPKAIKIRIATAITATPTPVPTGAAQPYPYILIYLLRVYLVFFHLWYYVRIQSPLQWGVKWLLLRLQCLLNQLHLPFSTPPSYTTSYVHPPVLVPFFNYISLYFHALIFCNVVISNYYQESPLPLYSRNNGLPDLFCAFSSFVMSLAT